MCVSGMTCLLPVVSVSYSTKLIKKKTRTDKNNNQTKIIKQKQQQTTQYIV